MRPDARACSRTAAASRTGSRTVNTVASSGTATRPDSAALGHVTAGLPLRAAQPPGQHAGRLSRRNPGLQQAGGSVDMRRVLGGTGTAITRHDMKILQITSNEQADASSLPRSSRSPAAPLPATARSTTRSSARRGVQPGQPPATRRSHAPSSTPSSTPARNADRSSPARTRAEPTPAAPPAPPATRRSPAPLQPPVTQRSLEAEVAFCVGGVISPLLANIYLHVLDTELARRGLGELVRYADDGVVLCRSAAQARAALDAVGEILASLGLRLHPDKTKVVDLREGREGLDFLGCHFRARMSGRLWEQKRIVRYYLHRWPSQRAMKRLRDKVRHRTGRNRAGADIRDVIADLNPLLRGWGNYFRTGNAAAKFRQADDYVVRRLRTPDDQEAGPEPARRAGPGVDGRMVQRARPLPAPRHHPLSEGSVTMSRRSSVSRMRENRTYGLKGGWGNGPARHRAPDYQ